MVLVFMSHDVDWPRHGPGKDHILARKARFDYKVIDGVVHDGYNPYYNIPNIMEWEERFGIRSTFFFRPYYDDGSSIDVYEDDVKELIKGGWEVGVHLNRADSLSEVSHEKKLIDELAGCETSGSRVHYLKTSVETFRILKETGFKYDSSVTFSKTKVDQKSMGYLYNESLLVFPITIMDAYLFTYFDITEDLVVNVVKEALNCAIRNSIKLITILWHDASLKMKGGRKYREILEYLSSRDDVKVLRGMDIASIIHGG